MGNVKWWMGFLLFEKLIYYFEVCVIVLSLGLFIFMFLLWEDVKGYDNI